MIFCMDARTRRRPHIVTSTLRARGTITIPQDVRDALDLAEGDQLVVTVEEDRIVLTPTSLIPDDQAWFWTPEWQAGERDADADLGAGRTETFGSGEEFMEALGARAKPGARRRGR